MSFPFLSSMRRSLADGVFVGVLVASLFLVAVVSAQGDDMEERTGCTPTSFLSCIGNTNLCPCYSLPCVRNPNTVHKAIVADLNDKLVSRDYANTALYLDENIILTVPAFGVTVVGREKVVGYFALGDPDVSDSYELLVSAITETTQEQLDVVTFMNQTLRAVQTGTIFSFKAVWNMKFSHRRQITHWVIYTDSLAIATNLLSSLDPNPATICANIQLDCTGANNQYVDVAACVNFLITLPFIDPTFGLSTIAAQASYGCRSFHEILARTMPNIHCLHVGPQMLTPFSTPCFNWQLLFP